MTDLVEGPPRRRARARRRTDVIVVIALVAIAAGAWLWSARQMGGMAAGPGAIPGALVPFVGTWTVMTAAMMLPANAPAIASIAGSARRRALATAVTTAAALAGYLAVWGVVGAGAYGVVSAGGAGSGGVLGWERAGRAALVAMLLLAASYQLSPPKRAALRRCTSPARRAEVTGLAAGSAARSGLHQGLAHGLACVACSWALMGCLLGLGVTSLQWMALVTALVTAERLLPRPAVLRAVVGAVLVVLAVGILVAPDAVPGLTIPGPDPAMMTGLPAQP